MNHFLSLFSIMKESPRWLITQKRYDSAYKILFKQQSHYEIAKPAIESTIIVADKKLVRFHFNFYKNYSKFLI